MTTTQAQVLATIESFLTRAKKTATDGVTHGTPLFADGLGLDSLETAELSATLEDEYQSDPFSAGERMPETVGDVLDYYDVVDTPV